MSALHIGRGALFADGQLLVGLPDHHGRHDPNQRHQHDAGLRWRVARQRRPPSTWPLPYRAGVGTTPSPPPQTSDRGDGAVRLAARYKLPELHHQGSGPASALTARLILIQPHRRRRSSLGSLMPLPSKCIPRSRRTSTQEGCRRGTSPASHQPRRTPHSVVGLPRYDGTGLSVAGSTCALLTVTERDKTLANARLYRPERLLASSKGRDQALDWRRTNWSTTPGSPGTGRLP